MYIVNPLGATHSVPDSWHALLEEGFHEATEDEIAVWYADQGLENPHAPVEPPPIEPKSKRKPNE